MKKVIILISLLLVPALLIAGGIVRVWDSEADELDLKSDNLEIKKVSLSSSTASLILSSNSSRKGVCIKNVSGSSSKVYIATYAATATTNLYDLADTSEFSDEGVMAYTGVYYGLGADGASCSVKVIEKE